jgi:hypothetical protein
LEVSLRATLNNFNLDDLTSEEDINFFETEYMSKIAAAAGVDATAVTIDDITVTTRGANARRRLLQVSLTVSTIIESSIAVQDAGAKEALEERVRSDDSFLGPLATSLSDRFGVVIVATATITTGTYNNIQQLCYVSYSM